MRLRDAGELTIEEAGFPRSTTWALSGDTDLSSPVGTQPSPSGVPTEQTRALDRLARATELRSDLRLDVPARLRSVGELSADLFLDV